VCVNLEECDFLTGIHLRLHPSWHARLERTRHFLAAERGAGLAATVTLVVDARGRLAGAWLEQSSGVAPFDLAAVEAALAAVPFPPPAPNLVGDDGFVRLTWRFAGDTDGCTPLWTSLHRVRFPLRRALPLLLAEGRITEARDRLLEALPRDAEAPAAVTAYATEVLRQHAGNRDPAVRRAAALGLGVTGDPVGGDLARRLLVTEPHPPAGAVRILARHESEQDLELLLRLARRNDGPASVAAARLAAARGAAPQVIAALEPALTGTDPEARAAATEALCGVLHPGAERALTTIATSGSRDPSVRVCAIETLGRIASPTAAKTLARLVAAPEPTVRAAALVALGRTGRLRLVARYRALDHLHDPALAVRAAAAATLVRVATSPGEWRRPLAAVFAAGDAMSGLGAVDSLASVGGSDAARTLERLMSHPRAPVRAAAATASQSLRLGRRYVRPAAPPPPVPEPPAAPPLPVGAALAGPDLGLACAAARQVAPSDSDALRHLVTQLTSSDPLRNVTMAGAFLGRDDFECPPTTAVRASVAAAMGSPGEPHAWAASPGLASPPRQPYTRRARSSGQ
jgi:TonB family protein